MLGVLRGEEGLGENKQLAHLTSASDNIFPGASVSLA